MSAPNYSPSTGIGSISTQPEGNYYYGPNGWYQISSAMPKTTPPVAKTVAPAPIVPTSQPTVPTQQNPGPSLDDQMAQIESMFNANNGYLDEAKTNLQGQYDTTKSGIDLQKTQQTNDLNKSVQENDQLLGNQQSDLWENNRSAYAQASRAYNSRMQQSSQLFGYGSGTGQAISDIVYQEYIRSNGNVQTAYAKGLSMIYQAQSKNHSDAMAYQQALDDKYKQTYLELDQKFRDGMLQINGMKSQNETAKSQAKYELMKAATDNAQAIRNQQVFENMKIDAWLKQMQYLSENDISSLNDQAASLGSSSVFQNNKVDMNNAAQNFSTITPTPTPTQKSVTYNPTKTEDQYSSLVNYFA